MTRFEQLSIAGAELNGVVSPQRPSAAEPNPQISEYLPQSPQRSEITGENYF